MAAVSERFEEVIDPERAWLGTVVALVVAVVGGSLAFPKAVYDNFVWHYFWGPVYADAHGANCAYREGGQSVLLYDSGACAAAAEPVAYPGYTIYSEVGYAVVGLIAVIGIAFLLRRLKVDRFRALFFGLFPFMLFGGALRVVEDVNDAVFDESGRWILSYPSNTLLISPLIYVTVFVIALAALVAALYLTRRGYVSEGYEYPLVVFGTVAALIPLGILLFMWQTSEVVNFFPQVLIVVLGGAAIVTAGTWFALERFAPGVNAGTRYLGIPVIFGQAVDGVANVVGLDWATALVPIAGGNLTPKHPVNQAVVNFSESVFPAAVTDVIGVAWPFLLLKIAAAVFILWVFNEEVMEESPRYSIMLLIGAVAVGLGPGTRDMLRATFWV